LELRGERHDSNQWQHHIGEKHGVRTRTHSSTRQRPEHFPAGLSNSGPAVRRYGEDNVIRAAGA